MRESLLDCVAGSLNRRWTFVSQERAAVFWSAPSAFGDDYAWHGGSSAAVFEPQVFNQSRTSSPVRCWPRPFSSLSILIEVAMVTPSLLPSITY